MWTVAEMDEETAEEGSSRSHMETFLERGILRNKKTFSAVFDRIYLKVLMTMLKTPPMICLGLWNYGCMLLILVYVNFMLVHGPCSMRENSPRMKLVGNCWIFVATTVKNRLQPSLATIKTQVGLKAMSHFEVSVVPSSLVFVRSLCQ